MKEGFLIGGGLIFAGLMLQLSVGPVMWDAFAWPANGMVLSAFVEKIEKCNEQGAWGVLWAKEAWGHYWSWDPKETWAAITWIAYLVYIHYRQIPLHRERLALWMLIISFVLLQMCWWGINYLPSAQGSSVHTY